MLKASQRIIVNLLHILATLICVLHGTAIFAKSVYTNAETNVYPFDFEASHLVKCTFPQGTPVDVLEERGYWYKVKGYIQGEECTGWVKKNHFGGRQVGALPGSHKKLVPPRYAYTKDRPTYVCVEPTSDYPGRIVSIIQGMIPIRLLETELLSSSSKWYRIEGYVQGTKHIGWIRDIDIEFTAGSEEKLVGAEEEYEFRLRQEKEAKRKEQVAREKREEELKKRWERAKKEAEKRQLEADRKKKEAEKRAEQRRHEMANKGYVLKLLNWHWSSSHGYTTAEGQVRNISGRRLEKVVALVSWYNEDGDFITSGSSLLEYTVLMPDQTSPFSVMERYNPLMSYATVEFKYLFGGGIRYYRE